MINKCVFEVDGVTSFLQRSNAGFCRVSLQILLPPSLILRAFKFSPRIFWMEASTINIDIGETILHEKKEKRENDA